MKVIDVFLDNKITCIAVYINILDGVLLKLLVGVFHTVFELPWGFGGETHEERHLERYFS